jgi:hypothetical protein
MSKDVLHSLPIPTCPWESIGMDFIGPFPESNGFDYLLVVICRLTSMVHLVPTRTTAKVIDIAWLYLCEVVKLHGLPKSIVSDRDTKFVSKFWKELHRIMGTKLMMSMAYHPQMDGATECAIRQVSQVLQSLIKPDQTDWANQCPMVEFAMNSTISSTMEFAPFELNYSWMPTIMTELDNTQYNGIRQFTKQALQNLSVAHDAIITNCVSQIEQANKLR